MNSRPTSGKEGSGGTAAPRHAIDGLRIIALFKFGKVLLVIALSYGFYRLLDPVLAGKLYEWTANLSDRPERRLLLRALLWIGDLGTQRIRLFAVATILYTALLLTEGIGLWLRRRWGEWFTVITTSSLIPFELWELIVRGPGRRAAALAAFVINVLIVLYLVYQLRVNPPHRAAT